MKRRPQGFVLEGVSRRCPKSRAKSGELDLNLRKVLHVLDNNVITYADQTVN